ncbi:DUF185-domain-containing protein [Schizopora paradoxa]|uniref:Protein arginine methyltransferase NDUFAF7 n=1 Tax=Schizopora paradoxa TaxID=27342 RepID=A0A0H2S572_9AGAM|nr:DUF185-domain-containing protein [Schizopora paradoxa]
MLVRDFIEDSLYNPHYGYFPKQATIFSNSDTMVDFSQIRNGNQFQELVAERYAGYGMDKAGPGRQIFHTPTELFRPYYGQAIAQCLVSEYLLKYFPYEDFNVYEIGAGNGTLATDILSFIQERYPEVYDRTHYTIIEISQSLVKQQLKRLQEHSCAKVVHKSVFRWDVREPAPCFMVAMEVVDNFAHDIVRYNMKTLEPFQTYVCIDNSGDFSLDYTKITDPLISSFLSLRHNLSHPLPLPTILQRFPRLRQLYGNMPFVSNLSPPEYVPTRLLSLLYTLRSQFPLHRLLLTDFSSLPDAVPGYNAPVVQTRFQNTMVACSSILVKQGFFDIFFPTDFERLRDMYENVLSQPPSFVGNASHTLPLPPPRPTPLWHSVSPLALGSEFFSSTPGNRRSPLDGTLSSSGLPVGQRRSGVFSHEEFMQTYADLDRTRLGNGENPLLDYYKNVKFLF